MRSGRERAVGPEAEPGDALADTLPQFAGAQRGVQLLAARPAADPYLAEVAERGPARLALALDLYDLVAAFHCVPGVHGSHHAGSNDDDSHGGHAPGGGCPAPVRTATGR